MQRADWSIYQGTSKFVVRQVVSLMKNGQQGQRLLLKVDARSTFRTKFLQPATKVFVARVFVDHARWKTQGEKRGTSTKTCDETMLHAKLSIFVSRISPP